MLKGLNPLLGPELLQILRAMGHGDEIVIADANFPATSMGQRIVRLDSADAVAVTEAIISVLPLDTYDSPAFHMHVVEDPEMQMPIFGEFLETLQKAEGNWVTLTGVERFAFYERARKAYAIVSTAERRLYGNLILKKGVIAPN